MSHYNPYAAAYAAAGTIDDAETATAVKIGTLVRQSKLTNDHAVLLTGFPSFYKPGSLYYPAQSLYFTQKKRSLYFLDSFGVRPCPVREAYAAATPQQRKQTRIDELYYLPCLLATREAIQKKFVIDPEPRLLEIKVLMMRDLVSTFKSEDFKGLVIGRNARLIGITHTGEGLTTKYSMKVLPQEVEYPKHCFDDANILDPAKFLIENMVLSPQSAERAADYLFAPGEVDDDTMAGFYKHKLGDVALGEPQAPPPAPGAKPAAQSGVDMVKMLRNVYDVHAGVPDDKVANLARWLVETGKQYDNAECGKQADALSAEYPRPEPASVSGDLNKMPWD